MGQRYRLNQIFIQTQGAGNRAAQLCDFQRMRQSGPKQIAFMVEEDLRFVNQTPKSCGVNDAITISLKVIAGWRWHFGMPPTARVLSMTSVDFKHSNDQSQPAPWLLAPH
jgi:hypothetical protein